MNICARSAGVIPSYYLHTTTYLASYLNTIYRHTTIYLAAYRHTIYVLLYIWRHTFILSTCYYISSVIPSYCLHTTIYPAHPHSIKDLCALLRRRALKRVVALHSIKVSKEAPVRAPPRIYIASTYVILRTCARSSGVGPLSALPFIVLRYQKKHLCALLRRRALKRVALLARCRATGRLLRRRCCCGDPR